MYLYHKPLISSNFLSFLSFKITGNRLIFSLLCLGSKHGKPRLSSLVTAAYPGATTVYNAVCCWTFSFEFVSIQLSYIYALTCNPKGEDCGKEFCV